MAENKTISISVNNRTSLQYNNERHARAACARARTRRHHNERIAARVGVRAGGGRLINIGMSSSIICSKHGIISIISINNLGGVTAWRHDGENLGVGARSRGTSGRRHLKQKSSSGARARGAAAAWRHQRRGEGAPLKTALSVMAANIDMRFAASLSCGGGALPYRHNRVSSSKINVRCGRRGARRGAGGACGGVAPSSTNSFCAVAAWCVIHSSSTGAAYERGAAVACVT